MSSICGVILLAVNGHDVIPPCNTVVTVKVCERLVGNKTGLCSRCDTGFNCTCVSSCFALEPGLDSISGCVVEATDVFLKLGSIIDCTCVGCIDTGVAACTCPGLTVHNDLLAFAAVHAVEHITDFVHYLPVMSSHKVKTEAVDVVLFSPELKGLLHVASEHLLVRCKCVTASCTVVVLSCTFHTVVVTGNCVSKGRFVGTECVVVNNTHDNRDTSVVESLNKLLELCDSYVTVVGVCGVETFGNVVVLGIVTPVVRLVVSFVAGCEVKGTLDVNSFDTLLYKVVNAYALALVLKTALNETEELAFILRGNA